MGASASGPFPRKGPEEGGGRAPWSYPKPIAGPARLRSGRLGQGAKTQSQSLLGEAERSARTQFALAASNEMDCFSDIVCNVTEQEDGISDAFCANNGGAERYASPISAVTKKCH